MIAILALLLTPSAGAADGYWHPDDLMPVSKTFGRLSEGTIGPFEERMRRTAELAEALARYRVALDLLGDRAPAEERERLAALEQKFNREKAVIEAFASALIDDVDSTFYGAVERALGGIGGEIAECPSQIPKGPHVPGMRQRMEKNPDCTGEDLNGRIAAALDGDAALTAAVDEILALTWPDFTIGATAMDPVGGGSRWIGIRPLVVKGASDRLRQIDQEDETARLPFQAALEEGADEAEIGKLEQQAAALDAATAAKRAAVAAPVILAAEKSLAKWGESAGWCANPVALGGCTGEDASSALVERLAEDPRVEKAFRKARTAGGS